MKLCDPYLSIRMIDNMIPKNLTQEQRNNRKNIPSDIMKRLIEEPDLLTNVITCDETWIFHYDLGKKRLSIHCQTPTFSRIKKE